MEKPGLKEENTKPAPKEEATKRQAHTLQLAKRDRSMLNFQNFPERIQSPDNNPQCAIEPLLRLRYQQESREY